MIDLDRYKKHDGNEATTAEGLESNKENMTNEEKAKEIADFLYFKLSHIDYNSLNNKLLEVMQWKDEQIAKIIERLNGNIEMTNHLKEELKNENE